MHAATPIEQNKATARRWSEELWSRGRLAVADEIIAADYMRHDPGVVRQQFTIAATALETRYSYDFA